MTPLRYDDVTAALPDLDELGPVRDHLLARSVPDPARRWSASGEVDSAGARLVASGDWASAAAELAARERDHLAGVYRSVLEAVAHLERGDGAAGARTLLEAAALEEGRDRPARAEAYAASASDLARAAGEPELAATAVRRRARAKRALRALAEAERLYVAGHEMARDVGDRVGAAEGAIGAGNVLEQQGRWREAAEWYTRSLELLPPLTEPRPEHWHALLNLHIALRSHGEVDESVEWLERASQVAEAVADPGAAVLIENARGQLHMARGAYAAAAEAFRTALSGAAGPWASVNFRLNLGEALLAQGRTLEAAEEVREAERDALRGGVAAKLPEVYRLLGRVAAARGNEGAFVLFERALAIGRARGLPAIEEALTLQAYAETLRGSDPQRAAELAAHAEALYEEVGIHGERARWSDTFGVARDLPDGAEGGTT
jgi:tetratricopeptide (TPR) repeat protein